MGNQLQIRVNNEGSLKLQDFHLTKTAITPQVMLQTSNCPIITHLICGCWGQLVIIKAIKQWNLQVLRLKPHHMDIIPYNMFQTSNSPITTNLICVS